MFNILGNFSKCSNHRQLPENVNSGNYYFISEKNGGEVWEIYHLAASDNGCGRQPSAGAEREGGGAHEEVSASTTQRSDLCRKPAAGEAENRASRALEFHFRLFFSLSLNSTRHLCTQKPFSAAFKETINHLLQHPSERGLRCFLTSALSGLLRFEAFET